MPITLLDWFCLKDGRSSFIPRLPDDARLVFCHEQLIQHDILSSARTEERRRSPRRGVHSGAHSASSWPEARRMVRLQSSSP